MDKPFSWNAEKNEAIKADRGFGFEDVVAAISSGGLLDDIPDPSRNFPHQRTIVVSMRNTVVLVPYVEDDEMLFLKTAHPSRRARLLYQGDDT